MPDETTRIHTVHTFSVQAVLFDMDGTLIDSTPAVERSWATWAERWGVHFATPPAQQGRPARDIVREHLPAAQVDAAFADIEATEVADTAGIVRLAGVPQLLASLPADRWAVVTSCSAPLAAARLSVVDIRPGVLVTASDTERGKPDPAPYLAAAARLGFAPRNCLVVEDAAAGLQAGRAAGCATLGVIGTLGHGVLQADAVAASLEDVSVVAGPDGLRVSVRIDDHAASATARVAPSSSAQEGV
ncbi:HAD-IA family hydrolase [uncultured Amnibacterium sp.]|uniref:HAD-IA family hydrolase n=1 Tax=uncultured Amnibacterium sp. TaxID=1631851 RepID=UPI0035C97AD5